MTFGTSVSFLFMQGFYLQLLKQLFSNVVPTRKQKKLKNSATKYPDLNNSKVLYLSPISSLG